MDEKSLKPQLRFKGFSDAWEQRKFDECIVTASFKPYLAEAMETGKYPVIQQGDIPVAGYSDKKPFNTKDVVLFGDHTLSLYTPKTPFLLASDGVKILSIKNFKGDFLYQLLKKYIPKSEGYKRHFSILKECIFSSPKSLEQNKIAEFLSNLDNLITLHQRK